MSSLKNRRRKKNKIFSSSLFFRVVTGFFPRVLGARKGEGKKLKIAWISNWSHAVPLIPCVRSLLFDLTSACDIQNPPRAADCRKKPEFSWNPGHRKVRLCRQCEGREKPAIWGGKSPYCSEICEPARAGTLSLYTTPEYHSISHFAGGEVHGKEGRQEAAEGTGAVNIYFTPIFHFFINVVRIRHIFCPTAI